MLVAKDKIKHIYARVVSPTSCDAPCNDSLAASIPIAPQKTGRDTIFLEGFVSEYFPDFKLKNVKRVNKKIHTTKDVNSVKASTQFDPP